RSPRRSAACSPTPGFGLDCARRVPTVPGRFPGSAPRPGRWRSTAPRCDERRRRADCVPPRRPARRAVPPGGTPITTAERVARNVLLKAMVQATRLLSLAFVVIAARDLGPEAFGKFTFAYALATLLGAALDLGMHSVLVRSVARTRADTAAYWAAAV